MLQALASCFCFQSFVHTVITECGTEDLVESMPLAVTLATLLEGSTLLSLFLNGVSFAIVKNSLSSDSTE